LPDASLAARQLKDFAVVHSGDLMQDILWCQRAVENKGMEMLVLDQTRPDVKMPVVKVIVPGLRHFWARFAPGRLYDVPVEMGWLPKALAESELNPIPIFF
jgi:ribosomal protein S12 methylthiotransferase accessory factor YcaO